MFIILAFIILFHLAGAILLFVSTIHNVRIQNATSSRRGKRFPSNAPVSSFIPQAWWVVSPAGREVIYADLWYSCNSTCYPVENSHTVEAGECDVTFKTHVFFFVFLFKPPRSPVLRSVPAGGAGHYDPVHNPVLHQLLHLHPAALQDQAGREVHFHGHHRAAGLYVKITSSIFLIVNTIVDRDNG